MSTDGETQWIRDNNLMTVIDVLMTLTTWGLFHGTNRPLRTDAQYRCSTLPFKPIRLFLGVYERHEIGPWCHPDSASLTHDWEVFILKSGNWELQSSLHVGSLSGKYRHYVDWSVGHELDRSFMIGWRNIWKILKPWKGVLCIHFRVCLSVCLRPSYRAHMLA